MEAAPRLELGIKDLQSSALPLGYAAVTRESIAIMEGGVKEAAEKSRPFIQIAIGAILQNALRRRFLRRRGTALSLLHKISTFHS